MPRNFARHEQFLRIFALLEVLSDARQPIDDKSLIATLRERLGLTRLSVRTLHRDCEFLVACGYPIDQVPLPDGRRQGWLLSKDRVSSRKLPLEPLTLLELVAFEVGRDLLKTFEGTVLWTGIESLRHKLERDLSPALLSRLEDAKQIFRVRPPGDSTYASRPRLISTLSGAITDRKEIEIEEKTDQGSTVVRRLLPHCFVIDPPAVKLVAFPAEAGEALTPDLINIDRIGKVTTLDAQFTPRPIDPTKLG
jgi:predicted DNA-binding transcriptional regulator YafY